MCSRNIMNKEERRKYYQKNKESIYRSHRAYIESVKEKRKEYLREYCSRPDVRKRRRELYQLKIGSRRAQDKAHYHRTKERHSEIYRCRKYGISVEEYRELIARGKCEICGETEKAKNKVLAIDHCHKTNKVRGLLCSNCNNALGRVNDKIEILENMKNYLLKYARPL